MTILLVNPVNTAETVPAEAPPLGLGHLHAAVQEMGHDARILDLCIERQAARDFERVVHELQPEIVGFGATTPQMGSLLELAAATKRVSRDIRVIAGGSHPTALPEATLEEANGNVDLVVCGEGEEPFREIVAGADLRSIAGIAFRADGRVRVNPRRPPLDDIARYPLYDRDMFRWQMYAGFYPRGTGPHFGMMTSRGCPFSCSFCASSSVFGRSYRRRSVPSVMREIEGLVRRYGATEVTFFDDLFTMQKSWVEEFCRALIRADLGIAWKCLSRADTADPALLALMAESGCWMICYGIESGSPVVLDRMGKRLSRSAASAVLKDTQRAGIKVFHFYMIGNEGEDRQDFLDTMAFAEAARPDVYQLAIATPFPGSGLYERHEGFVRAKYGDWNYDIRRFAPQERICAGCSLTVEEMNDLIGTFKRRMNAVGARDQLQFAALKSAPTHACEISARAVDGGALEIAVRNIGLATWSEGHQVRLGLRFLNSDGALLSEERHLLAQDVAPGGSVAVAFKLPNLGRAKLLIDMVKEHEFWFSDLSGSGAVELSLPQASCPSSVIRRPGRSA